MRALMNAAYRGRALSLGGVAAVGVLSCVLNPALGQCVFPGYAPSDFISYNSFNCTNGVTFDLDGEGPLPPELVVYGGPPNSWDGHRFAQMAACTDIRDAAVHDGVLYIAGGFVKLDQLDRYYASSFDGTSWSFKLNGFGAPANAVEVFQNQVIYAGAFERWLNKPLAYIGQWNGTTFVPLADGMDGEVLDLAVFGDRLIAGGSFTKAGGVDARCIAAWNGSAWSSMGEANGAVRVLRVMDGALYAAGSFTSIGGVESQGFASWDGTTWRDLSHDFDGAITGITVHEGELIVTGPFSRAGDVAANRIAKRTSDGWRSMGAGINEPASYLGSHDGALIVGATLDGSKHARANALIWRDNTWKLASPGARGRAAEVVRLGNRVYSYGNYIDSDGVESRVVEITNDGMKSLGRVTSTYEQGLVEWDGTLLLLGQSMRDSNIGGAYAPVLAWNGERWERAAGIAGSTAFTAIEHDGRFFIGGHGLSQGDVEAPILAWDGISWSGFEDNVLDAVYRFATIDGQLYAMTNYVTVVKLVGNKWVQAFAPIGHGRCIVEYNGDIVVGGTLNVGNRPASVARWTGSAFEVMGNLDQNSGRVRDLVVHDGVLYATGVDLRLGGVEYQVVRYVNGVWEPGLRAGGQNGYRICTDDGDLVLGTYADSDSWPENPLLRVSLDGKPTFVRGPEDMSAGPGSRVVIKSPISRAEYETREIAYRWERDGVAVVDGQGGASVGGGVVSGATSDRLVITGVEFSDAGSYVCFASSECGERASTPGLLTIACPADLDGSGFVDTDDYSTFVLRFEAGDATADFDGSGFVDTDDFAAFVSAFESGC